MVVTRKQFFLTSTILVYIFLFGTVATAQTNSDNPVQQQEEEQRSKAADEFDKRVAQEKEKPKIPPGVNVYMGRRVAKTMHFAGAEWLVRNEREREERCSLMLANLGLKPGMTVCDMGCGNGFHSLPIAKLIGEKGQVVGVDVQPEMLGFLRERAEAEGVENIIPILGSYHNPRLPPNSIDIVLMVDVYHEFSHPEQMLAAVRKSLKPDGLVVLVEFREEDPKVPIKRLHKMSKAQVNKELLANGYKLEKEFNRLPWQHMMFFGIDKDADANKTETEEDEKKSTPTEEEKTTDAPVDKVLLTQPFSFDDVTTLSNPTRYPKAAPNSVQALPRIASPIR